MADPTAAHLLARTYDALVTVLRGVDDDTSWSPTGCRGWTSTCAPRGTCSGPTTCSAR